MQQPSTPVYGSGHASLDHDHDLLYIVLQKLKPALDAGSAVGAEAKELFGRELLAYAEAHFQDEEKLMERYRYPGIVTHKEEPKRFRIKAEALVRACTTPNADLRPLVAAVEDWIANHTRGVDARFAEFLSHCNSERGGGAGTHCL